ncbi:MAG: ABC transporter permease [Thermodesulfobacteriota bacterium]|nr:ABC transporter permease [Thermodesulfobacteriota bacterium]
MAEGIIADNDVRWERLRYFIHLARKNPLFLIGVGVVVLLVIAALFAPWVTPFPEDAKYAIHFGSKLKPPSMDHFFGTDALGRDIFTRVVFGARMTIRIGVTVLAIALALGVPLGLVAGYFGGRIDDVIMRISDIFLSFPSLLLPLAIAAALGPSITNAMIAIAVAWFPWYVRIVRAQVLTVKEELYVESARSIGVSRLGILFRHVLPNAMAPVIIQASMDMGYTILTAAGLSFIGVGARPPTVEWGLMITDARAYFLDFWWTVTFPGLAIFVTVLAFNLLGDGLRDILDPKVRD